MVNCQLKNLSTRSVNPGGSCRSGKLNYIVSGIPSGEKDPGALALQEVRSIAPDELDGVGLSRITLVKSHGGGIFEVQAEYADSPADRNSRKKIGYKPHTVVFAKHALSSVFILQVLKVHRVKVALIVDNLDKDIFLGEEFLVEILYSLLTEQEKSSRAVIKLSAGDSFIYKF